jgi:hypothetical protein
VVVVVVPMVVPVVRRGRGGRGQLREGEDGDGGARDDQLHDPLELIVQHEGEAWGDAAEDAGEEAAGLEGQARVGVPEERGDFLVHPAAALAFVVVDWWFGEIDERGGSVCVYTYRA